jgi:hypothetical protein
MSPRRTAFIACALCTSIAAFGLVLARRPAAPAAPAVPEPVPAPAPSSAPALPSSIRSLVIAGGPLPDSSEVSLEQNARLALAVLPAPCATLFAGGPGTQSVRVEDTSLAGSLSARLGELFAPRASRASRFRASDLPAGRADLPSIESALTRAFAEPASTPLTVYVAAHGEQAEQPADNAVLVWGNEALTARRLAALHDDSVRPLQLIVTSCFSGGFAELAFRAADEAEGPPRAPRCGLFAGTWDRETSGCDPNPDRAAQEGYSLHLLHALAGHDRQSAELPKAAIDLDGDGRISLLEAHARARIAARSIDVPTTTSERYLRGVQKTAARAAVADLLPEDAAVARELGRELGLTDEASARAELRTQQAARAEQAARVAQGEEAVDQTLWPLLTRLLERYPVLDDPYHSEFPATLRDHAAEIDALLTLSPEALAHRVATEALVALDERALELELREARLLRLTRAHETLGLAAALKKRGGSELERYRALLSCERMPLGLSPLPNPP